MNNKYYLKTIKSLSGILVVCIHTLKERISANSHALGGKLVPLIIQNTIKNNLNFKNQMQRVNALQCE